MLTLYTTFGIYEDGYFRLSRYLADGSLFIAIWSHSEGALANLTVCLGDPELAPDESYVDINNLPEVLNMVVDLKIGTPIGKTRLSGYCTYPVVKFNKDVIMPDALTAERFSWEDKTCI